MISRKLLLKYLLFSFDLSIIIFLSGRFIIIGYCKNVIIKEIKIQNIPL